MPTLDKHADVGFWVGAKVTSMTAEIQSHLAMDDIYTGGGELVSEEVITWQIQSNSTNNEGFGAFQVNGRGSNQWYVRRLVLSFEGLDQESALVNAASIDSIKLWLYSYGTVTSAGNVTYLDDNYDAIPSVGEGVPAAFGAYTFGNTLLSGEAEVDLTSGDGYSATDLASAAVDALTAAAKGGDGRMTIGVMDHSYDYAYAESDSGYISDTTNSTGVYLPSYTGTTRDPYLEITYTDPSSGYGHSVIGVAAANISNVNGVATANIANVNGV